MPRNLGSYGSVRPATFDPQEADIFYLFQPRGGNPSNVVRRLDPSQVLSPVALNEEGQESTSESLWGMYDLDLPEDQFSEAGIYNIYIRPREIRATIVDCGYLSNSEVKGIVLDLGQEGLSGISSFDGYRVEYYEDGQRVRNFFRIVTSTVNVEPVNNPAGQPFSSSPITYRINDSSSLAFLTLSPSTTIIDSAGAAPFLGNPGQDISISNTFFDPIHIEVEITENTLDNIAAALYGNQLKNVDNGQYGIFDEEGNLIQAFLLAEILNEFGDRQYEIRTKIPNEDANQLDFNRVDSQVRDGG